MLNQDVKQLCLPDMNDIEYLVCHVGLLWRRLLNAKTKHLGISGTEKRVLFCIARHPGLTQVKIATLLDLEPQNLMRSLDKLEKKKWVQKQSDKMDRRVKCLYVTTQAKKILAKIKALNDSVKPSVISNLDKKDMDKVVQQLALMRENILKHLEVDG